MREFYFLLVEVILGRLLDGHVLVKLKVKLTFSNIGSWVAHYQTFIFRLTLFE